MATVRFRDLIKRAGTPEIKSLWTDPGRDRTFKRAANEGRVLTVVQESRSKKKDFGEIGFHQQPRAAYFVFPKKLPASNRDKVIGINYDLVREPEPRDAIPPETLKRQSSKAETKRRKESFKQVPAEKEFKVRVRQVAEVEKVLAIQARSAGEARARAAEEIKSSAFDIARAKITTRVAGLA